MDKKEPKLLAWIASSKKDLIEFPMDVRKEMGHALRIAQEGGKHKDAKPLKGLETASINLYISDIICTYE